MKVLGKIKSSPLWFVVPSLVVAAMAGFTVSSYEPLMLDTALIERAQAAQAAQATLETQVVQETQDGQVAQISQAAEVKLRNPEVQAVETARVVASTPAEPMKENPTKKKAASKKAKVKKRIKDRSSPADRDTSHPAGRAIPVKPDAPVPSVDPSRGQEDSPSTPIEPGDSDGPDDPVKPEDPDGPKPETRLQDGIYSGYALCEDPDGSSSWAPYYVFVELEVSEGRVSQVLQAYGDSEGVVDSRYVYDSKQNGTYLKTAINGIGRRVKGMIAKMQNQIDTEGDPMAVDVVSTATWSSKAILDAYAAALTNVPTVLVEGGA